MRQQCAGWAAFVLLCLPQACRAQKATHVSLSGRDVAVWKPEGPAPLRGYPLVVFSHGFTGCNTQTAFLMEALAKAGYLVLAPNHKDAGCGTARRAGGRIARPQAPFGNTGKWSERTYADRRDDMEVVLDLALAMEKFDGLAVDAARVGIAGHSLGGYTVLALAGGWPSWKDPRVKAVLALSPHCSPFVAKGRLRQMNIPVMYQGGTRDLGETPVVKRPGGAYESSSSPKYYVELDGAGHFAWTNLSRRFASSIDAYSVAFFDAYLKDRRGALAALAGNRPKDVSDFRSAP
jgi:predicted dienelactone hydrolase